MQACSPILVSICMTVAYKGIEPVPFSARVCSFMHLDALPIEMKSMWNNHLQILQDDIALNMQDERFSNVSSQSFSPRLLATIRYLLIVTLCAIWVLSCIGSRRPLQFSLLRQTLALSDFLSSLRRWYDVPSWLQYGFVPYHSQGEQHANCFSLSIAGDLYNGIR